MTQKTKNLNLQSLSDKQLLLMLSQPTKTITKEELLTEFIRRYEAYLSVLCDKATRHFKRWFGPDVSKELYATILLEIYDDPSIVLKPVIRTRKEDKLKLRIQLVLSRLASDVFEREYIEARREELAMFQSWDPEIMAKVFGEPQHEQQSEQTAAPKAKVKLLEQDRIECLERYQKLSHKNRLFCDFLLQYWVHGKNLPQGVVEEGCEKFGMKREAFMKKKARMYTYLKDGA